MNQAERDDLRLDMGYPVFNSYIKGYDADEGAKNPYSKSRAISHHAWNAGYIDRHTLNKETK